MAAQRLLIAESNEDLRLVLARELQTFHYVRCCSTGTEALEILRAEKPDILILNMLLPEMDGLTLLETISAENIRPMVLALTTFWSDYLDRSSRRLGISYAIMKPFRPESIVSRVLDMKQYLNTLPPKPTPESLLEKILEPLSICPGTPHFDLVADALLHIAAGLEMPQCKLLYREIARKRNTTFHAVESGIRHVLDHAWSEARWQIYFPDARRRPSNKAFLQTISVLLRSAMEESGL